MGSQQQSGYYTGPSPLKMPGYWRRPIARVYSYNLDLGETYYSPMKDYLDKARREAIRATSEVRREVTPQVEVDYSTINSASQKAEEVLNTHRRMIREISEDTQRRVQEINPRYEDNI